MSESIERDSQKGNGPDYDLLLSQAQTELDTPEAVGPYSAEDIARLNFESFRFSQGGQNREDGGAHRRIIEYLVAKYGDQIGLDKLEGSRQRTLRQTSSFVANDKVHDPGVEDSGVEDAVGRLTDDWYYALEERPDLIENLPNIAASILKESLASDYTYLVIKGGRSRSADEEGEHAIPSSKFLSQVAYYGLSRHSTGQPEFDSMFADMVQSLDEHGEDPVIVPDSEDPKLPVTKTVSWLLNATLKVYLNHYPAESKNIPSHWQIDRK